jgi:predicted DNA-binding protein (MmcQ/YjbR family)
MIILFSEVRIFCKFKTKFKVAENMFFFIFKISDTRIETMEVQIEKFIHLQIQLGNQPSKHGHKSKRWSRNLIRKTYLRFLPLI